MPAPPDAPPTCGDGYDPYKLCREQAAKFVKPLQALTGWKLPERPPPPIPPTTIQLRLEEARRARPTEPPPAPPPPEVPGYLFPGEPPYLCIKNPATGQVDCYYEPTGALVWSNWQHGPWQGHAAPPGAPWNPGLGA